MPTQKIVDLYTFAELSQEAKENAMQWYREASAGDNFSAEFVIEDAKTTGALFGLDIDSIYYSGFSSQGDGALFEGSYSYKKGGLSAVKAYAPKDTELHGIVKELQAIQSQYFYKLRANTSQRGHYMHSGCMRVEAYHADDDYRDIGTAEDDLRDALRSFADWIYSSLERSYDWENSDEVVIDNIVDTECTFNKNGKRED